MPRSIGRARSLRHNSTDAERLLWRRLRARQIGGAKFRRQRLIGRFIVDFACLERRLVIEVDGGQHSGRHGDARRDAYLASVGIRVLRFWNHEVLGNTAGVLDRIREALGGTPSPASGRGSG